RPAVGAAAGGLEQLYFLRLVQRPVGVFADVDPVQRRLRQKDAARLDPFGDGPGDERQQQRRDVVAVRVGVGQDDDAAVAQTRQIEVLPEAATERNDQVRELFVLEHLRQRRALRIQYLAQQRQ